MKKILITILSVLVCGMILTGCGTGSSEKETETEILNDEAVLGTWTEDYFDSGYTFREDGTGENIFWDLSFTYTAADGVINIKYDDETYIIKFQNKTQYTIVRKKVHLSTRTLIKMIQDGAAILKEGNNVFIYPEGGRNKNESQLDLLTFHDGSLDRKSVV